MLIYSSSLFSSVLFCICYLQTVTSLTWKSCGASTDPIKIWQLDISPADTIPVPGVISVTGKIKLATNVTSPVVAKVEVKRKVFWGWLTVPCVDGIGSCTYDDVCTMSPYTTSCPPSFVKNQVPCRCPILQGSILMKKMNVSLDAALVPKWLEKGNYQVHVELFKNEQRLCCYDIQTQIN